MPTLHRTIVRPIVTEQSSLLYQDSALPTYTFEVHPDATKPAIKQAIEQLFGVKVAKVRTANQRGKPRKVGRSTGNRPNWKKAIVTLEEGRIDQIFEV